MGSILVAMPKYEDSKHIAGILRECGLCLDIEACTTGADVLRILHDRDFGVIVCTKRLSDMGYAELAEYLPNYFGMIVLTKDPSLETVSDQMVKLMLPLKKSELKSTIEMMTNEFYYQIRRKKRKVPKRSVKEQKMIDDAKAMLMERNGMSEPEAFRYIQKNSMDFGRTMVESAQMILMLGEE